jgi:serine/threonine-protein kinase
MNQDWSKVQEIFDEAWALDSEARRTLLARRCGADSDLRAEVDRMLEAFDQEKRAGQVRTPTNARGNQFGVWQTGELLGRGGMAEVYLAHRVDGQHEQRAALKVMSPYFATDEFIDRFRRERQMLARLEHPNIARLLDGGVSKDGEPYLVMEYIEGQRLDEYCDNHGLPIAERAKLMQRLCLAVESAHHNLILHRDIKPSNVLVTADGVIKLLDFGAARELDNKNVETHAPLTPAYASPEQLRDEPVNTLSDVYGLGATLYRLLAGVPPFGEGDKISFSLFRTVLEDDPPPPSASPAISPAARRELRGDLDNIVRKAMDKDPARRYASAERLGADLGRWLESRPVEARPRTWSYRAECFVKRNRWGVAFGMALLLTLIVGIAAIAWQVRQVQLEASRNARLTAFLTRVMGLRYDAESSPMRAHGRATRMVDVIRYAGERLDSAMAGQPQVEARLDADIGHALAELNYFDEAERSLHRGLQLADPRKDPVLAGELTGYLARTHFLEGSVVSTEKEFDEALRLIRMKPSPSTAAVEQLLLLNLVPVREFRAGLTPEVVSMIERAEVLGKQIGENSPAYALALQVRGDLRLDQGKIQDAENDVRRAMVIQESMSVVPLEHIQSMAVLSSIRATQGNFDEAARLLREASATAEEVLGRGSLDYQVIHTSLAELSLFQRDYQSAADQLAAIDREIAHLLPKALWLRVQAICPLAAALIKLNRWDEARTELQQAQTMVQQDPGADSPLGKQVTHLLQTVDKQSHK